MAVMPNPALKRTAAPPLSFALGVLKRAVAFRITQHITRSFHLWPKSASKGKEQGLRTGLTPPYDVPEFGNLLPSVL